MRNLKNFKSFAIKADPQSKEVAMLLYSIESRMGALSKYLRQVHDIAVHFSNIEIDEEMKSTLYFVAELSELIEDIEITSQVKK